MQVSFDARFRVVRTLPPIDGALSELTLFDSLDFPLAVGVSHFFRIFARNIAGETRPARRPAPGRGPPRNPRSPAALYTARPAGDSEVLTLLNARGEARGVVPKRMEPPGAVAQPPVAIQCGEDFIRVVWEPPAEPGTLGIDGYALEYSRARHNGWTVGSHVWSSETILGASTTEAKVRGLVRRNDTGKARSGTA